jgi:uncharacterized RDD family membrane protein YckC
VTTTGVSAGLGRRLAAALYDALLLVAVLVIVTTALVIGVLRVEITPQSVGPWAYLYRGALVAIIVGYYLLNWTRSGQTLGMRAWHLRAVTATGQRLSLGAATLRLVCAAAGWAPLGLGVLWVLLDRDHLALQDRLSNTRIVHLTRA